MTTYLNKEAVLKAAKDAMTWPEHAAGLVMRIERGEFDATPGPLIMAYTADKDAEIARLKKELFFVSSSAGIRGKSILASFRIIGDLKARIAELEKLTESQQGIINQQTEARQKARANMAKDLSAIIQQEWQCSLPEILYIIECVEKGKYGEFPKPAQKEPELFICPGAKSCIKDDCPHHHPHSYDHSLGCGETVECSGPCVPVKPPAPQPSPVPTSGTGTAPKGATTGLREWVSDSLQRHIRLIEACQNRIDELEERMLPSMAKDIGDLTLRMDNLESRLALEGKAQQEQNAAISKHAEQIYSLESETRHHNARLHEIEQRQGRDRAEIIGEIKDRWEDYHADLQQLVEENVAAHKEINKALKSLQAEVVAVKNHPILTTYDPTPRTYTVPVGTGPGLTTNSYNPCQDCQKVAEFNRQHPNGYIGDGHPCNLCQYNPNKVMCSK